MSKKILVVEDELSLSGALSDKLEKESYEVTVAHNGVEGLTALSGERFDLIVLDVLMPVMDGLSMLERLQESKDYSEIPVLVLTNLSDDETMSKSLQGGSFDFLVKSDWSLEAIVEKIKNKLN